jgi:hypothetical protein
MLAQTTASYTEKNTNSNRSVQRVFLVGRNGTTMTVRGKDGRGRTTWYLHVIDRLFSNPRDAQLLI